MGHRLTFRHAIRCRPAQTPLPPPFRKYPTSIVQQRPTGGASKLELERSVKVCPKRRLWTGGKPGGRRQRSTPKRQQALMRHGYRPRYPVRADVGDDGRANKRGRVIPARATGTSAVVCSDDWRCTRGVNRHGLSTSSVKAHAQPQVGDADDPERRPSTMPFCDGACQGVAVEDESVSHVLFIGDDRVLTWTSRDGQEPRRWRRGECNGPACGMNGRSHSGPSQPASASLKHRGVESALDVRRQQRLSRDLARPRQALAIAVSSGRGKLTLQGARTGKSSASVGGSAVGKAQVGCRHPGGTHRPSSGHGHRHQSDRQPPQRETSAMP